MVSGAVTGPSGVVEVQGSALSSTCRLHTKTGARPQPVANVAYQLVPGFTITPEVLQGAGTMTILCVLPAMHSGVVSASSACSHKNDVEMRQRETVGAHPFETPLTIK